MRIMPFFSLSLAEYFTKKLKLHYKMFLCDKIAVGDRQPRLISLYTNSETGASWFYIVII